MFDIKGFFKSYLQYFIFFIIILVVVYFYLQHEFVLGLIIGTIASAVNLFSWEVYLNRAKNAESLHLSTGNWVRYLVTIVACCFWLKYPLIVDIIGILIGLMIAYVLIMLRTIQSLD
ncbi:ATP synthase subunit I [Mammaliicoccus sp. Dog046]|uniref:ATP synthase subunit I n=1 Tax=Mammaliicoccus sp. Dog046 TaxID=3034233 RepID=UPI002B25C494|nr:ATP synthase subunit I [Mammaliicoccus sp. Dog046]WQK86101.1 ATP synthase subunit I [Mammaliicoccus sp. Dog046]